MSVTDSLQSKHHRDLLDIIDNLRSQGFGKYVYLPEIIVCGDQSSGKSSVLEAISGQSFPAKDGVCTRFATEVSLRRDKTKSISISITPGPDHSPEEAKALEDWKPEVTEEDGIETLIEKAKEKLGLSQSKTICNDTLHIELSGPNQPHLTMVDLPGLFKAGNSEQSEEDAQLVSDMVTRYMNRPRSIILAVVSAKNEYVLQEVTARAKKADPDGVRTLGLITKPDTLDRNSESEARWADLAQNKDVKLHLGWHVLKNRSYNEKNFDSAKRDKAENDFFSQNIWATLDPALCGVKALRTRLSSLLKKEILRQLPDLIREAEKLLKKCDEGLKRLGADRDTPVRQRQYLIKLGHDFSTLMSAAVHGPWTSSFFESQNNFEQYPRRLRAIIQNKLREFDQKMRSDGEKQVIVEQQEQISGERDITREKYIEQVLSLMVSSRGCELPGLFNPLIVGDLFSKQCEPWRDITEEFSQLIAANVYQVAEYIMEHVAAVEVVPKMLEEINKGIDQLQTNMEEKIKELLTPHFEQHAITYNPQLTANVQEAQRTRNRRIMQQRIDELFKGKSVDSSKVMNLFIDEIEPDMDRYGASLIVDYMQAYYKVALARFIDDIGSLAVESCLISKLSGLLTPMVISGFDQDKVTRLVGESDETIHERRELQEKLGVLQDGLKKLQRLTRAKDVSALVEVKGRAVEVGVHPEKPVAVERPNHNGDMPNSVSNGIEHEWSVDSRVSSPDSFARQRTPSPDRALYGGVGRFAKEATPQFLDIWSSSYPPRHK